MRRKQKQAVSNLRRNSKGQAEMLEWFPRLIMLLVAVIVIAMLVRYFADRDVNAADIHRASELYRIYYDGNLITYEENGRAYPGIIDMANFREGWLDEQLGRNGKISARLILTGCREGEIYHDKATYGQHQPFAQTFVRGPGSATIEENLLPVTIVDGERCSGLLNITIVRPNT